MQIMDPTSLAKVSENVNHAHFFGEKIGKSEARDATKWISGRFQQNLPARVRAQANPDPKWAKVPKSFVLTKSDLATRLHTFTGEPVKGASMRAIHSREAARALLILSEVTGKPVPEAEEHCRIVRATVDGLEERGKTLF